MGTFGWTELIDLAHALRYHVVPDGDEFNAPALLAMLRNDVCSQWAMSRGGKERFEFALMVQKEGSSRTVVGMEEPVRANVFRESFYRATQPYHDAAYFRDVDTGPIILIRATHGQGKLMKPILANLQVTMPVSIYPHIGGLFHATRREAIPHIMRQGILPMGRVGSMYSVFHHLDPHDRCRSMQRYKSESWNVIISLDLDRVKRHIKPEDIYINPTGTVTITAPVTRDLFEKVAVPQFKDKDCELTMWDKTFVNMKAVGAITNKDNTSGSSRTGVDDGEQPSTSAGTAGQCESARNVETYDEFLQRAKDQGWTGEVMSCPPAAPSTPKAACYASVAMLPSCSRTQPQPPYSRPSPERCSTLWSRTTIRWQHWPRCVLHRCRSLPTYYSAPGSE